MLVHRISDSAQLKTSTVSPLLLNSSPLLLTLHTLPRMMARLLHTFTLCLEPRSAVVWLLLEAGQLIALISVQRLLLLFHLLQPLLLHLHWLVTDIPWLYILRKLILGSMLFGWDTNQLRTMLSWRRLSSLIYTRRPTITTLPRQQLVFRTCFRQL